MGCCMSEPDFDEDAWDNHRSLKSPLRNEDTVSTVSGDTAAKNEVHIWCTACVHGFSCN
jgi:hypothetical protein